MHDPTPRQEAGQAGEAAALAYLQERGLQLMLRNYRCRGGEIDLVMLDRQVLVVVEVRLRSWANFGGAAASVTARKQRRLAVAAKHLLLSRPEFRRYRARFDVVALRKQRDDLDIEWIRDAFRL